MRRSARHVGRVRRKLAAMLQEKLPDAIGREIRADPAKLYPNQGYWRTDYRADVMPWEGSVEYLSEEGRWQRLGVGSWDKMTDLIRGFDVENFDGAFIELAAHHATPHPSSMK